MSLLEQDIMKKGQVNQSLLLKPEKKFEVGDNKNYEVIAIVGNAIYGHKAKN